MPATISIRRSKKLRFSPFTLAQKTSSAKWRSKDKRAGSKTFDKTRRRAKVGAIPVSKHLAKVIISVAILLSTSAGAFGQYTDRQAIVALGGPQGFAARRARLAKELKTGYAILFARNDIPEATHYREDNDFFYFTGLQDPGAVMVMDNEHGRVLIFEPQQVGGTAQVYGSNLLSLPKDEQKARGYPVVLPIGNLDETLSYMLHGFGASANPE